jgi:hypothetical protein
VRNELERRGRIECSLRGRENGREEREKKKEVKENEKIVGENEKRKEKSWGMQEK